MLYPMVVSDFRYVQKKVSGCSLSLNLPIANFCRDFRWNLESDRMSRRKSAKNGPVGAHGLNYKIFANFEVIFGIHDENYPLKKISCLSDHFQIFAT